LSKEAAGQQSDTLKSGSGPWFEMQILGPLASIGLLPKFRITALFKDIHHRKGKNSAQRQSVLHQQIVHGFRSAPQTGAVLPWTSENLRARPSLTFGEAFAFCGQEANLLDLRKEPQGSETSLCPPCQTGLYRVLELSTCLIRPRDANVEAGRRDETHLTCMTSRVAVHSETTTTLSRSPLRVLWSATVCSRAMSAANLPDSSEPAPGLQACCTQTLRKKATRSKR
jgi:hypothetical protein